MTTMKITIVVLSVAFFVLLGCGALGGPTPDVVAKQVSDILSDQIITPEEAQQLKDLTAQAAKNAKAFDWGTLAGTIAGSAALALLGVKLAPTAALQGPFDKKPA